MDRPLPYVSGMLTLRLMGRPFQFGNGEIQEPGSYWLFGNGTPENVGPDQVVAMDRMAAVAADGNRPRRVLPDVL